MKTKTFIGILSSIAIGLILIGYGITYIESSSIYFPAISLAILFTFLTTVISYQLLSTGLDKPMGKFINFMGGSVFLKLFLGIILIAITAWKFNEYVWEFVFSYFLSYLVFTAFEVFTLMRNLRAIFGKADKSKE